MMRGSSGLQPPTLAFVPDHQRGLASLGIDDHGAELVHPELFAATTHPLLLEDDRTAVLQLDRAAISSSTGEIASSPSEVRTTSLPRLITCASR